MRVYHLGAKPVRFLVGLMLVLGALVFGTSSAQAQSPVDSQVSAAMEAVNSALTPCSSSKFLDCVTLEKDGWRVTGTFTRTVNGGTEATDIKIGGNQTEPDAKNAFDIEAKSYQTPPNNNPPVEFWKSETFAVGPATTNNAWLQVWLAPNLDDRTGNGFGVAYCGNLSLNFEMTSYPPPGVLNPDGAALAATAQSQLKAMMQQLTQAIASAGACNGTQPPPPTGTYAGPYPTLATITSIENIQVSVHPKGFSEGDKRTGKTGTELQWGDKLCYRGRGTVQLKWFDGTTITLSDPAVGRTRGLYSQCFELTLKRPQDVPPPGLLPRAGAFVMEYVSNLGGFARMVVHAASPPPSDSAEFRFQASAHTAILAVKGTTFILGNDPTGASLFCLEEGDVEITPRNPSLKPFDLQAGNQVQVTETAVGAITPGCTLTDPVTIAQPKKDAAGMTVQAPQRYALQKDLVLVPVWLIKAANLANLNLELDYDPAVIQPEGNLTKGNLLDNALFQANPKSPGKILLGLAQTQGLEGTGTLANIPFRVVGKPGDVSPLLLTVTTINDPTGGVLPIARIHGEIMIVNDDGTLPPEDGGAGGGSGGGGTGAGGGNGSGGGSGNGTGGANGNGAPIGIQRGDCDGSGTLTELDALCALEMSVNLIPSRLFADMDASGDVTSRDAVLILQQAVGQ